MKTVEHLTKEQLTAYADDSLAPSETQAVGNHLLRCATCRDLLPPPTPEQFWSALLTDEIEDKEIFEAENLSPARPPLATVFSFFRQPLAWGAGALILVAGLSFLIWLGVARQSNSTGEISQTVETPKTVENAKTETESPPGENLPVASNDEARKVEKQENSQQAVIPKQPESNSATVTGNSKTPEKTENRELAQLLENTPPAVSSLRPNQETVLRNGASGDKPNSNSAPKFALIAPVGETVLETVPEFRWGKAADATNYRITIFDADFNEVLTAEVSGNSFKSDKPLKRGAKYLWRVAANTANGEVVAPLPPQPPAVFRVAAENAESRIEFLEKNENDRMKLAIFYAREGMLDSAACTLKEILAKTPKHNAARRLLAQVERWKKENNATVQRCGPAPTATKADQ